MYMTTMIWRPHWMNEKDIVQHMITFIEDKERQLQSSKLAADTQIKSDIVKAILDELERETAK